MQTRTEFVDIITDLQGNMAQKRLIYMFKHD